MSAIIDVLKSATGIRSLKPADASAIKAAEKELGLSFAKEYTKYTSIFGAVSFKSNEITGVVDSRDISVVEVTKSARKITKNIPADWYVVMDPHIDGIIIWQDEKGKIYQSAPNREPCKIADSLADYIASL